MEKTKKKVGIGKILLWIFFLPIMATIAIVKSKWKKTVKIVAIVIIWLIVLIAFLANGGESSENVTNNTANTVAEETAAPKVLTLVGNEAGEYGKEIILNQGKVDDDGYNYEHTVFVFKVPAGKYEAKTFDVGTQISFLADDGTTVNSDGIEELNFATSSGNVAILPNSTQIIEIQEGQFIKLSDDGKVELTQVD